VYSAIVVHAENEALASDVGEMMIPSVMPVDRPVAKTHPTIDPGAENLHSLELKTVC
jgi:hypothetical protein